MTTPNSVEPVSNFRTEYTQKDFKRILFVGRLTFQKNVEALIEALSHLDPITYELTVVGEGPSISHLKNLSSCNKVSIKFLPFTDDLTPLYLSHDFLCIPSRWEGFPNVLAEAFMHGLPAIGFGDCAGVSSLIKSDVNGQLVSGNDNPLGLAAALESFNSANFSPPLIRDSVSQYSEKCFEDAWIRAIENALLR